MPLCEQCLSSISSKSNVSSESSVSSESIVSSESSESTVSSESVTVSSLSGGSSEHSASSVSSLYSSMAISGATLALLPPSLMVLSNRMAIHIFKENVQGSLADFPAVFI